MQILAIAGNVGKDARLNHPGGGEPVLNFSIAVDNGKDKDGKSRAPTWFDCSLWGKRAEALEKYILKGTKLSVYGRPTCRAHDGKAYLGIVVDHLTFQSSSGQRSDTDSHESGRPQNGAPAPGHDPGGMDDDIPFSAEWR